MLFLLNSNWKRYRWGFHFHNPLLLNQIRSQHIEKPNHLTTRRITGFMIPGAYPPVLTGFCVMSQLQTISLCFLSCTWTALCVTELWSRKHPPTHTHTVLSKITRPNTSKSRIDGFQALFLQCDLSGLSPCSLKIIPFPSISLHNLPFKTHL